jgi:hypothetical protein
MDRPMTDARLVASKPVWESVRLRRIYVRFQRVVGGSPCPVRPFGVPKGTTTLKAPLDLKQGELVGVKPHAKSSRHWILIIRNRGLYFDPERVSEGRSNMDCVRRIAKQEHLL